MGAAGAAAQQGGGQKMKGICLLFVVSAAFLACVCGFGPQDGVLHSPVLVQGMPGQRQILSDLKNSLNSFALGVKSQVLRGGNGGIVVVTGGAGYIGTHCIVALQESGYDVVVIDNFCNSCTKSIERVEEITKKKLVECFELDIRDRPALDSVFAKYKNKIVAVIHCAGFKAVGESVREPLSYYENNFVGTLNLLKVMSAHGCKSLVFSSSATVYGNPHKVPIDEEFPLSCTNPYGRTKLFIEEMLRDVVRADPEWKVINLRYFNPVGAHPSGLIGEDPAGLPNNLMPYIAKVAVGKLKHLTVFGNDYDTPDGTGVRDYIHVMDLAAGHVAAVRKLADVRGEVVYNLGTGQGYSVIDMVKAMEAASGKPIPYVFGPRRPGDIATCYAAAGKALEVLGWRAVRTVQDMCADTWRWQSMNPNGYRPA